MLNSLFIQMRNLIILLKPKLLLKPRLPLKPKLSDHAKPEDFSTDPEDLNSLQCKFLKLSPQ
jgi:hypothetical protein